MENMLIAVSSDKGKELFMQLLKLEANTKLTFVVSGSEARRAIGQADYEMILINSPLPDEFGDELAVYASDYTSAGVLLVVKSELADEVAHKVEDYGVCVIEKPISKPLFYQALKLVAATRKRVIGLKKENLKLQNKLEEIRLVNRAKYVLIQYLNMGEEQAHKYIEKQAMDRRMTRKAIAENILKMYES